MPRGRPWGSRQCSRWIPCGASCAFEQCWLHGLCGLPCTKLWVQVPVNNTGFMCLWTTLALCACGQQKPYVPVNNACFTCFHILINTGYMCLWTTVASHAYKQHWTHIPSNTGWSDFMCLWTKCWLCVPVNNIGFMCLWTTLSSTKGTHMPVQKKNCLTSSFQCEGRNRCAVSLSYCPQHRSSQRGGKPLCVWPEHLPVRSLEQTSACPRCLPVEQNTAMCHWWWDSNLAPLLPCITKYTNMSLMMRQ